MQMGGVAFRHLHRFALMMSCFELVLHLMMGLLLISDASGAGESRPDSVFGGTTIYVDKSDSGNYASVQGAVDSVPDDNNQWIRIHIKPGTYNEKVKIPSAKQHIFLEGESLETTIIQYWDAGSATEAATFQVYADNFVASNITFKNSHDTLIGDSNGTRITKSPILQDVHEQGRRAQGQDITFAEVGCTGEGAGESQRVKWMKQLPTQELEYLLSKSFVNQEGWIEAQP